MEELLGALGISGPVLGAIVWYVKTRIVKNEKKLEKIQENLRNTLAIDEVQKMQIENNTKHISSIEQDIREIRKHLLKNG